MANIEQIEHGWRTSNRLNMGNNENDSYTATNAKGIEVFLRIRPSQIPSGYISQDDIDENQLIFKIPQEDRGIINNSRTHYSFNFNGILDPSTNQDQVFRKIGVPAVNNVLQGYNSTVFAYGQTGSGKTFTMTGGPERYSDRGIIPRAISLLFSKFQEDSSKGITYNCFISYLELYNESGFDLLSSSEDGTRSRMVDMPRVTMLEDVEGNYHFRNLSVNAVSSEEDALNLLFIGDTNRAIGETEMNQSSSRSHCIFSVMIEKRVAGLDTVVRSKLNLVDLAGSERVGKTTSAGQTLKEAQYINSSLFFLEMVIVALNEKMKRGKDNTHIPYRNSMMTSVLRDSLGGNCLTMMIATISPDAKQTDESISTCHFAARVALVKNVAYINEDLEPELVIRRLKAEVRRLREEVKFLKSEKGEDETLQDEQIQELKQNVRAFLNNGEEAELDMGALTLTKIQSVFRIFKSILLGHDEKLVTSSEVALQQRSVDTEIESLKITLAQRDEEIKILTDIIQKNQRYDVTKISQRIENVSKIGGAAESDMNQNVTKSHKFIPLKVKGVDRCLDHSILNDPSKAFTWFRERYPGLQALNENKMLLQEKFQEAKDVGDQVRAAKDIINQQKVRIEQIRRRKAVNKIATGINSDEHLPDEAQALSIVEKQNQIYKKGLVVLKELKGAIEHLKQLMEANQRKLQNDFDTWYARMYEILDTQSSPVLDDEMNHINSHRTLEGEIDNPMDTQTASIKAEVSSNPIQLPHGVILTGDEEADNDIIAFYKAKEALMARSRSSYG